MKLIRAIFENSEFSLFPLNAIDLYDLNNNQDALISRYHLSNKYLFNPSELFHLTEEYIIPKISNLKNTKEYIYHTRWFIVFKLSNHVVGEILIKGIDSNGIIEIGYGTYPEYMNKGLMTSGVNCFISFSKQNFHIKTIIAETNHNNTASIRVLQKNGFKEYNKTQQFIYWKLEIR